MSGRERRDAGSERRRPAAEPAPEEAAGRARLDVKKTWKLYLGGAFVRSESGRYLVAEHVGENYPRASRKDARDAVKAALAAQPGWRGKTAANRGQILYRLAEVMEARRDELAGRLTASGAADAAREVGAAIDRVVSFAGWTDKYQSLFASSNPVACRHFGFSVPEPLGVVAIAAPERPALLGLVGSVCPVIAGGNAAVVVASEADPLIALAFGECLATSDLPGGVVNLLTGTRGELLPHLAKHLGVRGLDLWDVDGEDAVRLERDAADGVKRVARRGAREADWYDAERGSSPSMIERFIEVKTIWHPMGA